MSRLLYTLLIGLAVASLASGKNVTRSDRQLMLSDNPIYQPTVNYYFIGTVQNGPLASPVDYERVLQRFVSPYYDSSSTQDDPEHHIAANNEVSSDPYSHGKDGASFRQLSIFGSLFNNRFANGNTNLNTFRPISNRVPLLVPNPDMVTRFGPCDAGSGEKGICVGSPMCSLYGGKASGSCRLGLVCCVNTVTKCSSTVTLNNTYFQSPAIQLVTPTSCTLTVKLDTRLKEQTQPICQVRLDFGSFSIAQPDGTSQCITDNFQVGGALNQVPVICGDNDNQHMYIHVNPSNTDPTDVRITFNLGAATISRTWNIRVGMIPCTSSVLAPPDCLQYFFSSSGQFASFNWKDVPVTVRQLANQNYKVCFRPELVNNKRADTICFSECSTPNGGDAFLLSGAGGTANGFVGILDTASCGAATINDYVAIAASNGVDDRYCGNFLNPATSSTLAVPVCSTAKPFEFFYRTDNVEGTETNNVGFCIAFQMQPN